ncbi:hypothetical protein AVEN_246745-1 [Araneus ventricosus]|uniref:MAM domain-containing protein n=1 Tax=Araneus ventricosus TaxID=182803 RepID=A0A4Y1ZTH0_ARAVE|nr:hypothetical protein AVEN_129134-1 [Araneus ventricosus]GBL67354.1 hypothetical protein AVEN_246745-1 [Araneus ventricosus]
MGTNGKEMHLTFILRCLFAAATVSLLIGPIVVRTALNYAYNNYTLGPCNFTDKDGFSSPCYFDLHHPQVNLSMFNWDLGCGEGAFWMGGPPVDNNGTGKGGYAFMDLSRMSSDETGLIHRAWLPTHPLNATSPKGKCLHFSYSIDGLSVGGLRVLVNATDVTYTIWETKDSTDGDWMNGKVSFTCETPFRLVMEAFPREPYLRRRGYVAVDDIYLMDGFCADDEDDSSAELQNISIGRTFDPIADLPFFGRILGRGGLVVRSRLWDRRVPGSRPDSTEDPPCMGPVGR